MRSECTVLILMRERKRLLGTYRCRLGDNIKAKFKGIISGIAGRIQLAEDRLERLTLVDKVVDFCVT
jgi:hypothetical protein